MKAKFDPDGFDRESFFPFELDDQRDSEWKDVRLSFHDWDWLHQLCGGEDVDGYYLNGYGMQGLVQACCVHAGLSAEMQGVHYNSEGDTCYLHFSSLDDAVQVATLAFAMIHDVAQIKAMVAVARANHLED